MAGGRKRASSAKNTAAKRSKLQSQKQLLDLPPEIIDLILTKTLNVPNQYYHPPSSTMSVLKAFMAPITQVSRLLRYRTLSIITENCLWIHIKIAGREALQSFEHIAGFLPLVPYVVYSGNALNLNCFEIHADEKISHRRSLRHAQQLNRTNFFLFPYNFDSFNRVCQWLRGEASLEVLKSLVIRYQCTDKLSLQVLQSRIIPSLLDVRFFMDIKFEVPSSVKPSSAEVQRMIGTPRGPSDLTRAALDTLRLSKQYVTEGAAVEARLKLLYGRWICELARVYLPQPEDWALGENFTDDHPIDQPFHAGIMLGSARNATGNRLRHLVHQIEYEATLGFRDLFEEIGSTWAMLHLRVFKMTADTWLSDRGIYCFGLFAHELAQYHYARAVMYRIEETMEELMSLCRFDDETPPWTMSGDRHGYCPLRDSSAAAQAMLACWIQPGIPEFEKLSTELYTDWSVDPDIDYFDLNELDDYKAEIRNESGELIWKGDRDMLEWWGEEDVLQYLDLARVGVSPQQSTDLVISH